MSDELFLGEGVLASSGHGAAVLKQQDYIHLYRIYLRVCKILKSINMICKCKYSMKVPKMNSFHLNPSSSSPSSSQYISLHYLRYFLFFFCKYSPGILLGHFLWNITWFTATVWVSQQFCLIVLSVRMK